MVITNTIFLAFLESHSGGCLLALKEVEEVIVSEESQSADNLAATVISEDPHTVLVEFSSVVADTQEYIIEVRWGKQPPRAQPSSLFVGKNCSCACSSSGLLGEGKIGSDAIPAHAALGISRINLVCQERWAPASPSANNVGRKMRTQGRLTEN